MLSTCDLKDEPAVQDDVEQGGSVGRLGSCQGLFRGRLREEVGNGVLKRGRGLAVFDVLVEAAVPRVYEVMFLVESRICVWSILKPELGQLEPEPRECSGIRLHSQCVSHSSAVSDDVWAHDRQQKGTRIICPGAALP